MSDAPKRMLEELDGGPLRSALEAGVKELPSEASLASLAAKLGLGAAAAVGAAAASGAASGAAVGSGAGGAAAGGATAGGTAVAGVKIVTVLKIAVALAVVGGGTAGVYTVTRDVAPTEARTPAGHVASVTAKPTASAPESPPASLAPPDPFASAASAPTPSARPTAPTTSAPASDPVEEARLLGRAQGALDTDPARALAAASEHAARYARGALAQEREVLAIDALLRLGRRKDAEARARAFRAAYPTSGHLVRLDALLAKP